MLWREMRPAEKVRAIKDEIASGAASAAWIGSALGCSRNSVISVVRRNGIVLPGIGQGVKRPRKRRDDTARKRAPVQRFNPAIPLNGIGVLFTRRDILRECAWPLWAGKSSPDKRVCGRRIVQGESYCAHHVRISTRY